MRTTDEEPTIESRHDKSGDNTIERHPAYAQIGANRVHGVTRLYGSDFEHHEYVRITISRSSVRRDLAHDWPYADKELIEVSLSEAQWAAFVSTLNSGMGTQCTIEHIGGTRVPGISRVTDRKEQISAEMRATAADALTALNELVEEIDALKLSQKQRDRLNARVQKAHQELSSNIPYIARSFAEHIETTTERAKIEVNAYVQNTIHRAGLAALSPFRMGLDAAPVLEPKALVVAPSDADRSHPVCLGCGHTHYYEDDADVAPWGRCRVRECDCDEPTYEQLP